MFACIHIGGFFSWEAQGTVLAFPCADGIRTCPSGPTTSPRHYYVFLGRLGIIVSQLLLLWWGAVLRFRIACMMWSATIYRVARGGSFLPGRLAVSAEAPQSNLYINVHKTNP
jgi:hypothetical protein